MLTIVVAASLTAWGSMAEGQASARHMSHDAPAFCGGAVSGACDGSRRVGRNLEWCIDVGRGFDNDDLGVEEQSIRWGDGFSELAIGAEAGAPLVALGALVCTPTVSARLACTRPLLRPCAEELAIATVVTILGT